MSDSASRSEGVTTPPTAKHSAERGDVAGAEWLRARRGPNESPITYGMCLSCRSVEVALNKVIGTRDFSTIGESPAYPVGYGCEVCS